MATIVCLVGEQPMPVLLPARHLQAEQAVLVCSQDTKPVAQRLQKMIAGAALLIVPPYDLGAALTQLRQRLSAEQDAIFNLSGGTKLMAMAAFLMAAEQRSPVVYLESQRGKSVLLRYHFEGGVPRGVAPQEIPSLITLDEYLRAHLPDYDVDPPPTHAGANSGERFEIAVHNALVGRGFEALARVRPRGVAKQIEIDLIVRCGNQVGIAEVKLGDAEDKATKSGLDQLAMAGAREYLGTYTAKFLICARKPGWQIGALAEARDVAVIELPHYRGGDALSPDDADLLAERVRNRLTGSRQAS